MNDYRQIRIDIEPAQEEWVTDLLAQFLADAGYESFIPDAKGLTAFIRNENFSREAVEEILSGMPVENVSFNLEDSFVEGRDWNAEWEKNYFKPIVVEGKCVIHSSFHTDVPKAEYDIVIDPKMAFGTGHHATTSLMISGIFDAELQGKTVTDVGTGTGILAILAAMRGAKVVNAIEIDPPAQVNAVENVRLNGHPEINVILGDASALKELPEADLLLANINRNIILNDISEYAKALKSGGIMLLSGFYLSDSDMIVEAAHPLGLEPVCRNVQGDNWCCLKLRKL